MKFILLQSQIDKYINIVNDKAVIICIITAIAIKEVGVSTARDEVELTLARTI